MFYPVAVDGRMPFVDQNSHRDQQIKRVIQKHRAKRHRDSLLTDRKNKNNGGSVQPRMPLLEHNHLLSTSSDLSQCGNEEITGSPKFSKSNIIHAIKQWFSSSSSKSSKPDAVDSTRTPYKPKYQSRGSSGSQPVNIDLSVNSCKSRKKARESSANSPPGVTAKRQRTRTVSNIGSVMETIVEELACDEAADRLAGVDNSDNFGSISSTDSSTNSCVSSISSSSLSDILIDATPSSSSLHLSNSTGSLSSDLNGHILLDS